jgi:hypothetical protein
VSVEGDEFLLIFSVEKERRAGRRWLLPWSSALVEKERSTCATDFNGGCSSC